MLLYPSMPVHTFCYHSSEEAVESYLCLVASAVERRAEPGDAGCRDVISDWDCWGEGRVEGVGIRFLTTFRTWLAVLGGQNRSPAVDSCFIVVPSASGKLPC